MASGRAIGGSEVQPGGPRLLAKHLRQENDPTGGRKLGQRRRSGERGGVGGVVTRGLLVSGFISNFLDAGSTFLFFSFFLFFVNLLRFEAPERLHWWRKIGTVRMKRRRRR